MARPTPTEIRIDERGDETHESWLLIRANRVTYSPPGARFFDSEINHQHGVVVDISRCTRQRQLNRDWLYARETILEMSMSQAQWGAFVSSFGDGGGVPATLDFLGIKPEDAVWGRVPRPADEVGRLETSIGETRAAADDAFADIKAAQEAVQAGFERKAGRREMAELLRDLETATRNAPANVAYAAKSLTEHAEKVVTKARADIEGYAAMAQAQASRTLTSGDDGPLGLDDGRMT